MNGLGPSEQTSVLLGTSCALTGGSVKCWGANMSPTLIALADGGPLDGVVQLGVGFGYACVRTGAGAVLCWGQNNFGQLGIGNQIASEQPSVPAIASGAVELSVGYQHACAILDGGALQCWGSDVFHESGVVMTDPPSCDAGACVPRPATKSLPTAARLVSASQGQTLVVGQDNNVYGWGLDNYDQLGAPTSTTCAVGSNSVSCSFDPLLVNGIY